MAEIGMGILDDELSRQAGLVDSDVSPLGLDVLSGERPATDTKRAARLLKITAALAEAITPAQVYEAVVDQVAAALEASSVGLWVLGPDTDRARLVRATGYTPAIKDQLTTASLDAPHALPVIDAIRTATPLWVASQAELVERYPHLQRTVDPSRSYRVACLPIVVHGQATGSLGLTFDHGSDFDEEYRAFLLLVAHYSGQALERLRLLEAEQLSRVRAEESAARLALLSRASRAFAAAGSDVTALLQALTEQVTIDLADACAVSLLSDQRSDHRSDHRSDDRPGDPGEFTLAAVHHRRAELTATLRQCLATAHANFPGAIADQVVSTGESFVASTPLPSSSSGAAVSPSPPLWMRGWSPAEAPPVVAAIMVPLRSGGKTLGTLTAFRHAGTAAADHRFTEGDKQLMEELGERAAMAVVSSRLAHDNEQARLRAELLHALAGSVINATSVGDVFSLSLGSIQRALAAQRSSILLFDPDGVMRFKSWNGLSEVYRQAVEGHSPWSRDTKNPEPIFVDDVQNDPAWASYLPVFRQEGIGALGFIPLMASGKLLGKFMVYYDQPRRVSRHEIEVATAIANHVAAALARFSALDELKTTVRFNEMFTAILGHDLRNPLSAIMTAAQLVVKRGETENLMKPMARILTSGERMARMIEQLLDFTRVRVGAGIPLQPAEHDLLPVVRQVVDELEDANPTWSLRLEASGDCVGSWDRDRLSQVFSNLVANAIQHGVAEHGVDVRVDGTATHAVSINVRNGGQIPPALLPTLFEPLSGGERPRRRSRGLGLGLFITQQIVIAHGGSIAVTSSAAEGTRMVVSLPRAPVAAVPISLA
ncbi:MAG: GAF domain-containing protein [Myxococcales bacterium]